jgi:CRP-like cAMP-binding protein
MYSNLIKHIKRFVELNENEIPVLDKYIKSFDLNKKKYLLQEGQVCKTLYFVEKGCLRMFFIDKKAREQITQFAIDGWWISDYFSFLDNKPTEYNIQTIEKSKILSINILNLDNLLIELPQLEKYFRIIAQRDLAASQRRNKYLYEMSKEEFYKFFTTSFPEFVQRVPQYMIASYLGLTPEYVSELRKKS